GPIRSRSATVAARPSSSRRATGASPTRLAGSRRCAAPGWSARSRCWSRARPLNTPAACRCRRRPASWSEPTRSEERRVGRDRRSDVCSSDRWAYTIEISNRGSETVQLKTRHWRITDAFGRVQEVRGAGVVGEEPVLEPGASFEYTSGVPLPTPSGFMVGTYEIGRASCRERQEIRRVLFRSLGLYDRDQQPWQRDRPAQDAPLAHHRRVWPGPGGARRRGGRRGAGAGAGRVL